jgi:hypothetical protein
MRRQIDELRERFGSAIEVVVAEAVGVESHELHRQDRRPLLEHGGQRRRGAEGVSRREGQGIGVAGALTLEIGGQDRRAPLVGQRGIELGVPVRHVEQLKVHLRALGEHAERGGQGDVAEVLEPDAIAVRRPGSGHRQTRGGHPWRREALAGHAIVHDDPRLRRARVHELHPERRSSLEGELLDARGA